jgi:hypothetical protein
MWTVESDRTAKRRSRANKTIRASAPVNPSPIVLRLQPERWWRAPAAPSVRLLTGGRAHSRLSMPPLSHLTAVLLRRIRSTMIVTRWAEDGRVSRAVPKVGSMRATVTGPRQCYLRRVLSWVQGSTAAASGGFLRRVRGKVGRWWATVASRGPLPRVYRWQLRRRQRGEPGRPYI